MAESTEKKLRFSTGREEIKMMMKARNQSMSSMQANIGRLELISAQKTFRIAN